MGVLRYALAGAAYVVGYAALQLAHGIAWLLAALHLHAWHPGGQRPAAPRPTALRRLNARSFKVWRGSRLVATAVGALVAVALSFALVTVALRRFRREPPAQVMVVEEREALASLRSAAGALAARLRRRLRRRLLRPRRHDARTPAELVRRRYAELERRLTRAGRPRLPGVTVRDHLAAVAAPPATAAATGRRRAAPRLRHGPTPRRRHACKPGRRRPPWPRISPPSTSWRATLPTRSTPHRRAASRRWRTRSSHRPLVAKGARVAWLAIAALEVSGDLRPSRRQAVARQARQEQGTARRYRSHAPRRRAAGPPLRAGRQLSRTEAGVPVCRRRPPRRQPLLCGYLDRCKRFQPQGVSGRAPWPSTSSTARTAAPRSKSPATWTSATPRRSAPSAAATMWSSVQLSLFVAAAGQVLMTSGGRLESGQGLLRRLGQRGASRRP